MTRTEWDWLLNKQTDETMVVIDDGVIAMLDEYVKKQSDAAFKRGVAAMREAATQAVSFHSYADEIVRALPDPEDTPTGGQP